MSGSGVYQISVVLEGIAPAVWRRILLSANTRLPSLHNTLQLVMGWDDYHLWYFESQGREYTDLELMDEDLGMGEAGSVRLRRLLPRVGSECLYVYDFGDNWRHRIRLEAAFDPDPAEKYPVCTAGERSCPPEDCGGVSGYEELLEALRDPKHQDHEAMIEWAGADFDPERFDRDQVNRILIRRPLVGKIPSEP